MGKRSAADPEELRTQHEIDTTVAHASRVYDYLLGGQDNFEVDRSAAEHIFSAYPGGVDAVRQDANTNRRFLHEVVGYLVGEVGVRQILDIGTGIPNKNNVHGVTDRLTDDCRVVYVDNDPIVLAHAHELLKGRRRDAVAYIDGDFRQPDEIIHKASEILDFDQPVALLLVGVLHVIPDSYRPHDLIGRLAEALAPDSWMAISQLGNDIEIEHMEEVIKRVDERMGTWNPPGFRSHDSLERFFDGFELAEPGVALAHEWFETHRGIAPTEGRIAPLYCALGRKL